jgi:branched-chain amino acid aminotransferase
LKRVTEDYVQANTNGILHAATEATLTPLNRGFLYGDSIYEVWRSYEHRIFAWAEHWQRLQASARSIHLSIPWSEAAVIESIQSTTRAFRQHTGYAADLYIRLQIFRGAGPIGLDTNLADRPGFVILVKPVPPIASHVLEAGLNLWVAREIKRNAPATLDPAWKTGNYLNNILGLREAKQRGADDVVFLNLEGYLTEASTSNLAFIRDNHFVTPPLSAGILGGITRLIVIHEVAAAAGLKVKERPLQLADIARFDEAMLLSTTKDIQPVGRIDSVAFRTGPDSVTRRLKAAFADCASAGRSEQAALCV